MEGQLWAQYVRSNRPTRGFSGGRLIRLVWDASKELTLPASAVRLLRIASARPHSSDGPFQGHRGTDGVFSARPTRGPPWFPCRDGKPVGPPASCPAGRCHDPRV